MTDPLGTSVRKAGWGPANRRLGLIGGIGTAAGMYYYRRLAHVFESEEETVDLLLAHADFHSVLTLVQSGNVRGLCGYLSRIIEYLAQAGCTFAAIAAATSHLCIDELQERSTIPLISLVDAVRMEVERRGAKRVCVFGTRFVMESDLLGALTAVDVVHLHPEDLLRVNEIYTSLARRGAASSHEREELVRLAETLVLKDGVDTIILGGTDLSAVFEESETSFPALDASDAHIASIVREVLESNEI